MDLKRARLLALAGVLAVIGSCVPLGGAIYHAVDGGLVVTLPAPSEHTLAGARVEATPGERARVVLVLDIASDSVQEIRGSGPTRHELRYRFPATLAVRGSDGAAVSAHETVIAWSDDQSARRTSRREQAAAGGGSMTLDYAFPRFRVPDDGVLVIDAAVGPDTHYGAEVEAMTLELRHALPDHTMAVITGVFMLLGGWVAAVVGVVGLIGAAAVAAPPTAAAATLPPGVRRIAMGCHLAGFAGYFIPFGNLIAPLALWLLKRESAPFIDEHGREALNFQLTMMVYVLLAFALILIVVGLLMLPLLLLFQAGMMIVAALRAWEGKSFRYPLTVRFLR